jgi:polyisoprenoid-binding protein YceI
MKKILILAAAVLFQSQLLAQNWRPVTAHISFTIKMLGGNVEGRFGGFQGKIIFDPANLPASSIFGTVDAATVETGNSLRNRHLREKSDFFETAKYPKLKMTSRKITKTPTGYLATMDLTIKEITKTIDIPMQVTFDADKAQYKGSTKINRKDWKIGGNTLGMGSDVTINISVNTVK